MSWFIVTWLYIHLSERHIRLQQAWAVMHTTLWPANCKFRQNYPSGNRVSGSFVPSSPPLGRRHPSYLDKICVDSLLIISSHPFRLFKNSSTAHLTSSCAVLMNVGGVGSPFSWLCHADSHRCIFVFPLFFSCEMYQLSLRFHVNSFLYVQRVFIVYV